MTRQETTHQRTAAIVSGDTEAFARLYTEHFDQMYAWARQATRRDEAFCLDAVQDAFVRIIKGMKPISTKGELMAWLRKVTLSACYDQLRRERRRLKHEPGALPREQTNQLDAERMQWIVNEMKHLDDTAATIMEMRYRFGWTLQCIGRAMGIKPGAVDGRLTRTTHRLRTKAGEITDE